MDNSTMQLDRLTLPTPRQTVAQEDDGSQEEKVDFGQLRFAQLQPCDLAGCLMRKGVEELEYIEEVHKKKRRTCFLCRKHKSHEWKLREFGKWADEIEDKIRLYGDVYDPRPLRNRSFRFIDSVLCDMQVDKKTMWLNAREAHILYLLFNFLDYDNDGNWDDETFVQFMKSSAKLKRSKSRRIFNLIDKGASGLIDFNEFYFLICLMLASHNNSQKEFMLKHSRMVFDLLDADGSGTISIDEFASVGFLFNLKPKETKSVFKEFDLSGDQELDYGEFQFFAQAALDSL